jgi:hypothetical protein
MFRFCSHFGGLIVPTVYALGNFALKALTGSLFALRAEFNLMRWVQRFQ